MPNYPFTKDILVAAVEKDFEKYAVNMKIS